MPTVDIPVAANSGQPATHEVDYVTALTAGDDYTIDNDGRTYVLARKSSGATSVLTFTTVKTVRGLDVADPTVDAPNSEDARMIGPFPVDLYGETVAISSVTNESGLGLAAFRV